MSFRIDRMITYLSELGELWSKYVKAGHFDMSFRPLFGHIVI